MGLSERDIGLMNESSAFGEIFRELSGQDASSPSN
jgi:hypothetical protein